MLRHHSQVNRHRKVDKWVEAHLIAWPAARPQDQDHWTMRALAGKVVELGLVESLSSETVRLWLRERVQAVAEEAVGIPNVSADFVAHM